MSYKEASCPPLEPSTHFVAGRRALQDLGVSEFVLSNELVSMALAMVAEVSEPCRSLGVIFGGALPVPSYTVPPPLPDPTASVGMLSILILE